MRRPGRGWQQGTPAGPFFAPWIAPSAPGTLRDDGHDTSRVVWGAEVREGGVKKIEPGRLLKAGRFQAARPLVLRAAHPRTDREGSHLLAGVRHQQGMKSIGIGVGIEPVRIRCRVEDDRHEEIVADGRIGCPQGDVPNILHLKREMADGQRMSYHRDISTCAEMRVAMPAPGPTPTSPSGYGNGVVFPGRGDRDALGEAEETQAAPRPVSGTIGPTSLGP